MQHIKNKTRDRIPETRCNTQKTKQDIRNLQEIWQDVTYKKGGKTQFTKDKNQTKCSK